MSGKKNEDFSQLFPIYVIVFCFLNWALWWHYQTLKGPTVLAVVTDKYQTRHKSTDHYYLTVRFNTLDNQTATHHLSVQHYNYADFAINDRFPIKYAEDDPTQAAFLGEPLLPTSMAILYLVVASIVGTSFTALRRKNKRSKERPKKRPRRWMRRPRPLGSAPAPAYSATRALTWTVIGVVIFGSGIVSCRHASNTAGPTTIEETKANEYVRASLLSVHYRPATTLTALVRLPPSDDTDVGGQTIRLPLTAERHALLRAKLSRPQTQALEVLVTYPTEQLAKVVLIEEGNPNLPDGAIDTDPFFNYNTLGMVLCAIGVVIFIVYLEKYVRHSNSYE